MAFLSQAKTAGALASSDKVSRFALPRSWVYLLASACILIMFLNARDGLENLYFRWTHEDEYGYGFLIAGLVPFLLWRLWPALYVGGQKNEWFGVLLAIAGQLCCVLGAAGESFLLEQIGLVVSLYGVGLGRVRDWRRPCTKSNRIAAIADAATAFHAAGDADN